MGRTAGHKIAVNLSWLGLQEVLARVAGFLLVLLLARTMSPGDYGALTICLSLMTILGLVVRAGSGSRATRLTAQSADNIPSLYPETAGLRIAMAAATCSLIALFLGNLSELFSVPASLLMLSSLLLLPPALTVAWAFRGLDHMKPVAMATGSERLLVLAGVLFLWPLQGVSSQSVMLLEILAGLAVVLFLRRQLVRWTGALPGIKFDFAHWGDLLRESLPVSIAAITASLYRHGDLLLLGILSGSSATAIYLVAQKLVLTLLIPAGLTGTASFPSASRHIRSRRQAATALQANLFHYNLLLLLPLCSLVMLYAPELLKLLFGTEYLASDAVLRILLLSAPFFAFATFQENLLLAVPRPRAVMACRVLSSCLHLSLSVLLIPGYGVVGAAVGCLAGQVLFSALAAAVWRSRGGRLPLQWRSLSALAASILVACLPGLSPVWMSTWQILAVSVPVYVACVLLMGGLTSAEIRGCLSYLLKSTAAR